MFCDLKTSFCTFDFCRTLRRRKKKIRNKYKLLKIFWTHPKTHHLDDTLCRFLLQMPSDADAPMRTQKHYKVPPLLPFNLEWR
jgi:hypothetical protein